MLTLFSLSHGEVVSLHAGMPGPGRRLVRQCESIFHTPLNVSFVISVLYPGAVITHLESLLLWRYFHVWTVVQTDVGGGGRNKPWKFLCCHFADITFLKDLFSDLSFQAYFKIRLTVLWWPEPLYIPNLWGLISYDPDRII